MRRLVLASIVACGASERASVPAVLPNPTPPKPPDICTLIEDAQHEALADPTSCSPPRSLKYVSWCVRAGRGAWGLVTLQTDWRGHPFDCGALIEGAEFGVVSPRFMARAIYVDEQGHAAMGPPLWWSTLEDVRAFDYDGDGVAELLVSATRASEAGLSEHYPFETPLAAVWHVHDGVVSAYAPSIPIRSFADVDADGRPDLITMRDFSIEAYDGDVTVYSFEGPEWAAHALPNGTFSFDDEVASSFVKRSCAGMSLQTADGLTLLRAAACARLNGAPPKQIEGDYLKRCAALTRSYESTSNAACRIDTNGTLSEKIAVPYEVRRLLER
jgi:hypothetical protein